MAVMVAVVELAECQSCWRWAGAEAWNGAPHETSLRSYHPTGLLLSRSFSMALFVSHNAGVMWALVGARGGRGVGVGGALTAAGRLALP